MEIIPLNKKILLKPIKSETKETRTSGGIYLTEKEEMDLNKAEVIALGEKVDLKIKKGDKVIYEDIGADKVGEDYIIVDENRIIALVR
ncbi:co-chaperone GroES [Candidatus Woesearchaeota archaeon]|nr:co-chaperone GroES family protein [Candidatus Woesearchaeota archaeon]RLE42581.1 MAG: co-chaperone GroES [Candidatus Woesearchaeota archaeon]